jgi:hypothetical protein
MKKLILRLLVLILSVYVAGSIYPLLAHEAGHSHGPAPAPAPAPPPPAPAPAPAAPPMLDTKGPQLPPAPPPQSSGGGGGCESQASRPLLQAQFELAEWKEENFDFMANEKINSVKQSANYYLGSIRKDIKQAQDSWHKADVEVNNYQTKKNQGTLVNPDLLEMAQEDRQEKWDELQRQKARLEKVEAWRTQKTREIWALRDRAKNGEYSGYLGLKNYNTGVHPALFN